MANLKFLMLQSLNFVPEVWEKLQAYVKKKKKKKNVAMFQWNFIKSGNLVCLLCGQ